MIRSLIMLVLLLGVAHTFARTPELGTVQWGRDIGEALSRAKETGKPVFLLFQEVPG